MVNKIIKIRTVDRYIFEAILKGRKKAETRAATPKYQAVKVGDILVFACGQERFTKKVKTVEKFKTISALLKKYRPEEINPKTKTAKEARAVWYSFPNYKEKIKQFGLVVWNLK